MSERTDGADLLNAVIHEVQVCNRLPKCVVCGHVFGPSDKQLNFSQGALGGEQTFSILMWALRCSTCDSIEASQKMIPFMAEQLVGKGIHWRKDRE